MRSGQLRGREHEDLGTVAAISEGPAAITLSRGGAAKTYSYLDPNEDSAAFAYGRSGLLVAVADGHHGNGASDLVLGHLLTHYAPAWVDGDAGFSSADEACATALDAVDALNEAILGEASRAQHPIGRTTFAMALVRPKEGQLVCVSVGDSLVMRMRADAGVAEPLPRTPPPAGTAHTYFLGNEPWPNRPLRQRVACESLALDDTRVVAVATDGLSEPGIGVAHPAATVAEVVAAVRSEAPELRPLAACKGITHAAMQAHRSHRSGDNVAAAVLWLEASRASE